MERLERHFIHEHPLILNEAQKNSSCHGCCESIVKGDSVYSCSISNTSGCYNFFLHKTCAELPRELEHRTHQHHRLRLQSHFPPRDCDVCGNRPQWKRFRFTYECLSCKFNLCLTCVLQDRSFHHEANNHMHPLTIMPMVATFRCDACNAEAKDLSYFCTTCQFWIHKSCASAPTTLKCEFHKDHPLVLANFLPEQYRRFQRQCSICKKEVRPSYWLYYCADCRFFSHIKCATSTETVEPSRSIDEVDDLNLVHLPMPHETSVSSLINQFVKDLSLADDSSRPADQISHWSHPDHPLVLGDELKQSNTEIKYDEMLCDGCVQPLSVDAFYGCLHCNYFLHRFCAELPYELEEHPSHPEHKLHINYKGSDPRKVFYCGFCDRGCNGIYFGCESCDFRIDMVCASLPGKIKHESHEHPLNLLRIPRCDASGRPYDFGFGCETCRFYLGTHCAVNMPTKIRHRWDPHPLHLLYHPVKDHPHEFDCERYSEDINSNYWFYHCRDCDLSFHMECIRDDFRSNMKYGAIIKVDYHQHSLTFVPIKWKRVCSKCSHTIGVGEPAVECAPCKYLLCLTCVFNLSS